MKLRTECPGCGKQANLDSSLVGKQVRCKGCGHVFRVAPASDDSEPSWLEEGDEGEPMPAASVAASPTMAGRSRSAPAGDGGLSVKVMIGFGAGAVALVLLAVLLNGLGGGGPAPAAGRKEKRDVADAPAAPSLFDRVTRAVTGSDPDHDPAAYPDPGPLLPPVLPAPALRDLTAHERRARSSIAAINELTGILASAHDAASLKATGERLQAAANRQADEYRQNPLPFPPTPAENAEVTRRIAGELRGAIEGCRRETRRISQLPGVGTAGIQLELLIARLSGPVEMELKKAEEFKAPPGPAPYVEIYMRFRGPDDAVFYRAKFDGLPGGSRGVQIATRSGDDGHRATFRVWPVEDAGEFAREIPFGKTTVKGRRIFLEADPIPEAELASAKEAQKTTQDALDAKVKAAFRDPTEDDPKPPADADDLTKALFALRSVSAGKRKEGVDRITRTEPIDERRDEVHEALAKLLNDTDGFLVNAAMKAMLRWRTDATAPALIKLLDRPDFGVRWEAEELLGRLGDPRAAAPLVARLGEDGIKAEPALRALGAAAEPALIKGLRDSDPRVRSSVCDVLKEVGGKDALQAMMTLPADPDPGVQFSARLAMEAMRARVGPIAKPGRKGADPGASEAMDALRR